MKGTDGQFCPPFAPPTPPPTFPSPPPPSTPNICFLVLTCLAHLFFLTLHPHTAQPTSSWLYTFFFLFISSLCSAWYFCHNSLTFSGQCGYWKGVKGGVGQGQCGYWKGSMEALVKVRVNINGRWSGSMGVLNNGGSMGALKKNNEKGIGRSMRVLKRGQRRAWRRVRSDRAWVWVRQGCGCGSDRGVAAGQTGGCFTGL